MLILGTETAYNKEKNQKSKTANWGMGRIQISRVATLLDSNVQFSTTRNPQGIQINRKVCLIQRKINRNCP